MPVVFACTKEAYDALFKFSAEYSQCQDEIIELHISVSKKIFVRLYLT